MPSPDLSSLPSRTLAVELISISTLPSSPRRRLGHAFHLAQYGGRVLFSPTCNPNRILHRCNRCDNRATAEEAMGTSDLVEELPKLLAYVLPVFSRRRSMRFVAGHVLRSQDVRLVRGVALAQTETLTRLSHVSETLTNISHVLPLCVCVCACVHVLLRACLA